MLNPRKRRRGAEMPSLSLGDLDRRLAALRAHETASKPAAAKLLNWATAWRDKVADFKGDHHFFLYSPSPKYKCIGFGWLASPADLPSRSVLVRGFPIWEDAPLLEIKWVDSLLDAKAANPSAYPGDFFLLHLAIESPDDAPEAAMWLSPISRSWNCVVAIHQFLTEHRRFLGLSTESVHKSSIAEVCLADPDEGGALGVLHILASDDDQKSETSEGASEIASDSGWPEGLACNEVALHDKEVHVEAGASLVDIRRAVSGRSITTVRMLQPPNIGPLAPLPSLTGPIQSITVNRFWAALHALYNEPRPTLGTASDFKRFLGEYGLSAAAFDKHRSALLAEKSDVVLAHAMPRHRAFSFRHKCIRRALETHLHLLESRGRLSPVPTSDATLDVVFVVDTAGQLICRQRVTIVALIPLIALQTASLDALLPWVVHCGSFNLNFRNAMMTALHPELTALNESGICFRGQYVKVRLICAADMAAAWQLYDPEDVYPVASAHWLTTKTGIRALTKPVCTRCTGSLAELMSTNDDCEPRLHSLGGLRIRGTSFRMVYYYPRLHASLHGVPAWLGDVANLLWHQKKKVHARWIAGLRLPWTCISASLPSGCSRVGGSG